MRSATYAPSGTLYFLAPYILCVCRVGTLYVAPFVRAGKVVYSFRV